MTSPLLDAKVRLEWAKSEIGDFERAIQSFFMRDPCRFSRDLNSKPGRILHRVTLPSAITEEWRKHVTRIASDLREPLDYATVAVGESLHAKKAEFLCLPIEDTAEAFEREMKKRKIERHCPELATFLCSLEPYKGPNNLLFGLHELSRANKHRKLAAIGMAAGSYALTPKSEAVYRGPFRLGVPEWIPAENGFIVLDLPDTSEFNGDIQVSFNVALPQLEGFEREPVTAVFMQMAESVQNVLAKFERQFFSK